MVRLLVVWAVFAGGGAWADALTARLDKSSVALGEAVSLSLYARAPLDALDTTPLDAAFEVFSRTRSQGADGDTLVLTLYPRRAGALRVPSLQLGTLRSAALPLAVSDGSATVPRVTAQWSLDPAEPRVNEPARLTLSVCDDGSLQWQRPPLPTQGGRVLRALGEDEGADGACTLHRYHWALVATQSGAASLAVPMLDASRFGERLRFPGAAFDYRALALPVWLPAQVPPVAPVVRADPLPARWPLNRPLSRRIEVTGGYSADGLKALLDLQLRDTPALGLYPPLIEAVEPEAADSPRTRFVVTLFWQPRASGQLSLPALRLPWYDLARGRLADAAVAGGTLAVFDPRWRRAGQAAGALAVALLLAAAGWQAGRMLRWRRARRRGLEAIRAARDAGELERALRAFSLTGRPEAPSLGAWQRRLRQEAVRCEVAEAVRQLERQRYGRAAPALPALRQAFLQALARVRPHARFRRRTRMP